MSGAPGGGRAATGSVGYRLVTLERAVGPYDAGGTWADPDLDHAVEQLREASRQSVAEELSWRFSPVAEILWALTWVFMEREQAAAPAGVRLACSRFPYYQWLTDDGALTLWAPEQPLCRWERLAFDVFERWQAENK